MECLESANECREAWGFLRGCYLGFWGPTCYHQRAITIESKVTSGEQRWVTIGLTRSGKCVIVVVHTDRNDRIRIISARPASRYERSQYEEGDI